MSTTVIKSELPAMLFSKESDEWATPWPLFNWLNSSFQFTLDPCATAETAKCEKFYTQQEDGLVQPWTGERVFMNPPYSAALKWMGEGMARVAVRGYSGMPNSSTNRYSLVSELRDRQSERGTVPAWSSDVSKT